MSDGYWEFIVIGWTLTFLFLLGVSFGEIQKPDDWMEDEKNIAEMGKILNRIYGFAGATIIGFIVWIFFT